MRKLVFIFFFIFFLGGAVASAQIGGTGLEVSLSPATPAPFEEVTITLNSFVFDIDSARITWIVDGQEALRGTGEWVFRIKTKDAGEKTIVDIVVASSAGTFAKRAVLVPAGVDLLVEAPDVYTPPFYRGRSLPTSESAIKVVAVPNVMLGNQRIAPGQLSYEWSRNGNVDKSGFGFKNSFFTFKNSMLNKREAISVASRGRTAELGASGLTLTMTPPKILFYREAAEGVLYQRALSNLLLNKETTVVAEPYFFSPKNIANEALQFVWRVNTEEVATPVKNKINLRPVDGGRSQVVLEVKNEEKLLLSITKALSVIIER